MISFVSKLGNRNKNDPHAPMMRNYCETETRNALNHIGVSNPVKTGMGQVSLNVAVSVIRCCSMTLPHSGSFCSPPFPSPRHPLSRSLVGLPWMRFILCFDCFLPFFIFVLVLSLSWFSFLFSIVSFCFGFVPFSLDLRSGYWTLSLLFSYTSFYPHNLFLLVCFISRK